MRLAYLFSVWVHILAATIWVGGAIFIALVLVPAVKHPALAPQAPALLRAAALLVISGLHDFLLGPRAAERQGWVAACL